LEQSVSIFKSLLLCGRCLRPKKSWQGISLHKLWINIGAKESEWFCIKVKFFAFNCDCFIEQKTWSKWRMLGWHSQCYMKMWLADSWGIETFDCIMQVQGIYASQPSKKGRKWSTTGPNSGIQQHPYQMLLPVLYAVL
jgi:hypothetical protein